MSLPFLKPRTPDISRLVAAVAANSRDDTLARFMPETAWPVLADFLTAESVQRGHVLIAQGALDRSLYFVESGTLRVHYGDQAGQIQIALLGPGAVVGEGAFFSQIERNATVQALEESRVWGLTPERFEKLSRQQTAVALALAMALGAIVSTRMLDVSKRVAVT
ncbi:MAG: cyclic nucleotide-binding domain-containing protein [Ramlibacter sp.]|nr:cyclic nucleotide-binding domain-containing protein [Ramlibacter sp.]